MNYKSLPYTQTYISYPDITALSRSLGLPPLPNPLNVPSHKPYLLPCIVHPHESIPNKSGALAESWAIALHLEKDFPGTKSIFPNGHSSYALALTVQRLVSVDVIRACFDLVAPGIPGILDPRGRAYFRRTRTADEGGIAPEDLAGSVEEKARKWKKFERSLKVFLEMLRGQDGQGGGPFLEGREFGYADAVLVGVFAWFHRGDREGWKRIMALGDGQFITLWKACEGWVEGQGEDKDWEWEGKGGVPEFEGE